ncbi:hypothetical protein M408DRAFT_170098 [Serendipita vermifera MAFF 305830]|uniref:Uncharacterized protein n=1 Tax=Serendipita vermifera MAFF 305830 TaxID=933852 RepID=A0A0C2W054_SERVB|nr:hypothetical protein M408DRAFT_170098 [Serendipita vermifera MAFF 305830]
MLTISLSLRHVFHVNHVSNFALPLYLIFGQIPPVLFVNLFYRTLLDVSYNQSPSICGCMH